MKKHFEIVIIGGGVMGASLCYHFSRAGHEVVLFEKNEICSLTSSSTAAMVLPSTKETEDFARLSWESYELYDGLEKELGFIELDRCGSMDLYFDEAGREKLEKKAEIHTKLGHPIYMMEREEALKTEPAFRFTDALGGAYCPEGGQVNPFLLCNAYIREAKRMGAEVHTFTEVTGLEKEGGRIIRVRTAAGDIDDPELVLCCAGQYCMDFAKEFGIPHHIWLNRGYNLISEKLPRIMKSITAWTQQTPPGNLLIGAIHDPVREEEPYDRQMEEYGLMLSARKFLHDFPGLKDVGIIRSYTGIRIMTDDGYPVIGPNGIVENFWIQAGHSSFLLNPVLSKYTVELYEGKLRTEDIPLVSHMRFEDMKKKA